MISAVFFKSTYGLSGFKISGHSGYSKKGNDIVCASVSSAVQLTANTITECFKISAEIFVGKDEIQLKLADNNTETGTTLIDGLKLHLSMLSEDYKGTIKITVMEV